MKRTMMLSILLAITGPVCAQAFVFDINFNDRAIKNLNTYFPLLLQHNQLTRKAGNSAGDFGDRMVAISLLKQKYLHNLSHVSSALGNAIIVKKTGERAVYIVKTLDEIMGLVAGNPEMVLLAGKLKTNIIVETTSLINYMGSIALSDSKKNLMGQLDRLKIVRDIYEEVTGIYYQVYHIRTRLLWAKKTGIWKSINPLQHFIEEDKAAMKEVLFTWNMLFKY